MIKIDRQVRMVAFDIFNNLRETKLSRKEIIDKIGGEYGIPAGTLYDWYRNTHIPYGRKGKIVYRPEIYYVVGALLGDGCLYKWRLTNNYVILVGDKRFATKYSRLLGLCINKRIKPYIDRSKNIWFSRVNNFELYELFKKSRADLDYLKNLILKSGHRAALFFVEGFFDAEGCVKIIKELSRITPKICLDMTNTNLEILNLVKALLLETLNIETRYSVQKAYGNRKICHHLRIYRKEDIQKFLKYVPTTKLKDEKIILVKNWLNKTK
ncbi:MAG: LAGLIDADG family homing endonuclease [bacterium]|nr:LAGLIDADG family homing endonuclease [bacterium]